VETEFWQLFPVIRDTKGTFKLSVCLEVLPKWLDLTEETYYKAPPYGRPTEDVHLLSVMGKYKIDISLITIGSIDHPRLC